MHCNLDVVVVVGAVPSAAVIQGHTGGGAIHCPSADFMCDLSEANCCK